MPHCARGLILNDDHCEVNRVQRLPAAAATRNAPL